MTTTATEPTTEHQTQGAVVGVATLQAAVRAVDTFTGDVERAFGREHPDDSVLLAFHGTHIVVDGGDSSAFASSRVLCDGKPEPFEHEEILVDRDDLRAVVTFLGKVTGDRATTVTIFPAGDGYLSFRVVEHGAEAVVPYWLAEVPWTPRRRVPVLVAAGAAVAVVASVAARVLARRF